MTKGSSPPWTTPAVVMPGDANSLAIIWSLTRARVPVITLVNEGDCPHRWSRYPVESVRVKSNSSEDLLDGLQRIRGTGYVLIPAADAHVAAISAQRAGLSRKFRFVLPPPGLAETLLDKRKELALIEELGIDAPRSVTLLPASPEELEILLGLPLIIKPRSFAHRAGLHFKTLVIRDRDGLARFYERAAEVRDAVIAQEVIPGDDTELWKCDCTFNSRSEMIAGFTFHKIRMAPAHFGVASLALSKTSPAVLDLAGQIGRNMQYTGPMNIEFKYDRRDGKYKYIEINPRLGMCNYFDTVCGVNNALLTYRLALGEDPPLEERRHRDGVLYCSFFGDLFARIQEGERLGSILRHHLQLRKYPRVGAFLSWRDPLPGVVHGGQKMIAGMRGFLRIGSRQIAGDRMESARGSRKAGRAACV